MGVVALCAPAMAQQGSAGGRVWVFFAAKGEAGAAMQDAIAAVEQGYDAHARQRRALRGSAVSLFDESDVAVSAGMVDAVRATGARVHVESRWLNAVSVEASAAERAAIAALGCVRAVEPVRAGRRLGDADTVVASGAPGYGQRESYGRSGPQLAQMNLPAMHDQGFTGAGVRIAILDTGFRRDHAVFGSSVHPLVVIAERDFINSDDNTGIEAGDDEGQHAHGTLILGTLASYSPGQLVGGAFGASFILCKTEDVTSETPIEEDNYVAALEFAEMHGADVCTSSLSYSDWYTQGDMDGLTAVTTIAVNIAASHGVHCCTAAGNAGHDEDPMTSHLGAPADGLAIITCGAVDENGVIAGFSSDGPTADGRIKPEVLALGVRTQTIGYWDTEGFAAASGTSLSTPLVAAAVACITQARPDWTPAQMRAAIFARSSDLSPDPLFIRGYGVLNAAAAIDPCGTADFNRDGDVGTDADIEAFFACLGGNCCGSCDVNGADFNGDGDVGTDADIEAFFQVLSGGGCP